MQILGCYYIGRTAQFASTHGIYRHWAKLMYAGALLTLVGVFAAILNLVSTLGQIIDDNYDG